MKKKTLTLTLILSLSGCSYVQDTTKIIGLEGHTTRVCYANEQNLKCPKNFYGLNNKHFNLCIGTLPKHEKIGKQFTCFVSDIVKD